MRKTVDQILNEEASRLLSKARSSGLIEKDLSYLNALISTYEKFVGSPSEEGAPEPAPEEQGTEALLESVKESVSKEK